MPRRQFTGLGDIRFVPIVTVLAAPTVAQITAGTRLTPLMVRDGLTRPQAGNTVDIADAESLFNKTDIGTYGGDAVEFKGYRDTLLAADVAWTTLARGVIGYLVIADNGWAQSGVTGLGATTGTPTIGDRCETWPITVISREPNQTAENQARQFTARMAVTGVPNLDAIVA